MVTNMTTWKIAVMTTLGRTNLISEQHLGKLSLEDKPNLFFVILNSLMPIIKMKTTGKS